MQTYKAGDIVQIISPPAISRLPSDVRNMLVGERAVVLKKRSFGADDYYVRFENEGIEQLMTLQYGSPGLWAGRFEKVGDADA